MRPLIPDVEMDTSSKRLITHSRFPQKIMQLFKRKERSSENNYYPLPPRK